MADQVSDALKSQGDVIRIAADKKLFNNTLLTNARANMMTGQFQWAPLNSGILATAFQGSANDYTSGTAARLKPFPTVTGKTTLTGGRILESTLSAAFSERLAGLKRQREKREEEGINDNTDTSSKPSNRAGLLSAYNTEDGTFTGIIDTRAAPEANELFERAVIDIATGGNKAQVEAAAGKALKNAMFTVTSATQQQLVQWKRTLDNSIFTMNPTIVRLKNLIDAQIPLVSMGVPFRRTEFMRSMRRTQPAQQARNPAPSTDSSSSLFHTVSTTTTPDLGLRRRVAFRDPANDLYDEFRSGLSGESGSTPSTSSGTSEFATSTPKATSRPTITDDGNLDLGESVSDLTVTAIEYLRRLTEVGVFDAQQKAAEERIVSNFISANNKVGLRDTIDRYRAQLTDYVLEETRLGRTVTTPATKTTGTPVTPDVSPIKKISDRTMGDSSISDVDSKASTVIADDSLTAPAKPASASDRFNKVKKDYDTLISEMGTITGLKPEVIADYKDKLHRFEEDAPNNWEEFTRFYIAAKADYVKKLKIFSETSAYIDGGVKTGHINTSQSRQLKSKLLKAFKDYNYDEMVDVAEEVQALIQFTAHTGTRPQR